MTAALETRGLTKAFETCVSFQKVDLKFEPGHIHAILGENGAGKSTLLKTLFGLLTPTEGEILFFGKPVQWSSPLDAIQNGIGMVQQHFTLVENQTVLENLILAGGLSGSWLRRKDIVDRIESMLPGPGFKLPWDKKIEDLPVGLRQKVEILKLLLREVKVLFLDEPTAVLTPQEVDEFLAMLKTLRQRGQTIVIITHKIREAREVADEFTVLRQGRVIKSGQMKDITDLELVEAIVGKKRSPPVRSPRTASSRVCLSCDKVRNADGSLRDINLKVSEGEIVGVAGVSGSGQVELVESILGLRAFEGKIQLLEHEVKISEPRRHFSSVAFVPQDRHRDGLWLHETVLQNVTIGYEREKPRDTLEELGQKWLRDFDVRFPSVDISVEHLSGGNQQKLIFARELGGRESRFIIAHEPTRGVDIGAVDRLHEILLQYREKGAATLLFSSELDELLTLSDRILVLFQGQIVLELAAREFDEMRIGAAMTGLEKRI